MTNQTNQAIDAVLQEQSVSARLGLEVSDWLLPLSNLVYLQSLNAKYAKIISKSFATFEDLITDLESVNNADELAMAVVQNLSDSLMRSLPASGQAKLINSFQDTVHALAKLDASTVTIIARIFDTSDRLAGPKYGAQTTASSVNNLMAKLVTANAKDQDAFVVYDPTAGEGLSLLSVYQLLSKKAHISLVGTDVKTSTLLRAKMLLSLLPSESTALDLKSANVLEPRMKQSFLQADMVVCDPPYSLMWHANDEFLKDPRFAPAGVLPPRSKADFAFVLDGLANLKDGGTMVIRLPHGVLFRGSSEAKIRQYLIDENLIDAVIGLPANLSYTTAIPTMLLVLRKNRKRKEILFIDASDEFEKSSTNGANTLPEASIKKILETYARYKGHKGYSHLASPEEVSSANGNLNIPRYVDTYTPPADIPLKELDEQITAYQSKIIELQARSNDVMSKYR